MTSCKKIVHQHFNQIVDAANACQLCASHLPHSPNPVFSAGYQSKLVIIGQAPGSKAHATTKPWNDASGERLRDWMGIDSDTFYDTSILSLIPMGFCYPGKGKSGDLPPRSECAPKWHHPLLNAIQPTCILLIGQYAQAYYLQDKRLLTERVQQFRQYLPRYFVLPHPSPRNNIWLKRHPWFERDVLPALKETVRMAVTS
ncbi:uracil-DNA glycosylase family protein [Aestuariibacter sp. AA17]|uniref:Uracil-DNA glycosylase family protein n=1 Tax=Fluctibacter corallii TaxID=2984329 RepID=A0ABT3AD76_9ALTE|nr:uracil-DNA glycosylase family protein [Aestuariibacter sp. AA17]MCV2886632.1 uracil-DNA glycosylase family protein [Aestuariibacter sp. AA17]